MSLSNNHLKLSLRLSAVTLVATLAGCSMIPGFKSDSAAPVETSSTTDSQSGSSSMTPVSNAPPAKYEPVIERISEPVPLAEGHPNEYVVQVGDTLWDIAATFLKDPVVLARDLVCESGHCESTPYIPGRCTRPGLY